MLHSLCLAGRCINKTRGDADLDVASLLSLMVKLDQFLPLMATCHGSHFYSSYNFICLPYNVGITSNTECGNGHCEKTGRDLNYNMLSYMDQFGNTVQIQGLDNRSSATLCTQGNVLGNDTMLTQLQRKQYPQNLEILRVTPYFYCLNTSYPMDNC